MTGWRAPVLVLVVFLVGLLGLFGSAILPGRGPAATPTVAPVAPGAIATPMAASPTTPPTSAAAGPAFQGRPVSVAFRDSCGSCHGMEREGGPMGPALVPNR